MRFKQSSNFIIIILPQYCKKKTDCGNSENVPSYITEDLHIGIMEKWVNY